MILQRKNQLNTLFYTWGKLCEGWHYLSIPSVGVKLEMMPKDSIEKWHGHRFADQMFFIMSGQALIELQDEQMLLQENESVHIPPRRLHRILNPTDGDIKFMIVTAPNNLFDRIEMKHHNSELREYFKDLNVAWIEEYFKVEPIDMKILSDPEGEITSKGGFIFYAMEEDKVLGVAALIKMEEGVFELGKMAVAESERGKGVGNMLMDYVMIMAAKHKVKKLLLYSNRSLVSAIHLYKKYGFVESPLEPGRYKRADIKMEKIF